MRADIHPDGVVLSTGTCLVPPAPFSLATATGRAVHEVAVPTTRPARPGPHARRLRPSRTLRACPITPGILPRAAPRPPGALTIVRHPLAQSSPKIFRNFRSCSSGHNLALELGRSFAERDLVFRAYYRKVISKILTRVSTVRSTPIRGPRNSYHEFAPCFIGVSEDAYATQGDDGDETPPVHDAVVVRIPLPGGSRVHPVPSADNCDRKLLPSPYRAGTGEGSHR